MESTPNPDYNKKHKEFLYATKVLHEALGNPHSMFILMVDANKPAVPGDGVHYATYGDCPCAETEAYQITLHRILSQLPQEAREGIINALKEDKPVIVNASVLNVKPSDN